MHEYGVSRCEWPKVGGSASCDHTIKARGWEGKEADASIW